MNRRYRLVGGDGSDDHRVADLNAAGIRSVVYSYADAVQLADWLNDREAGYPKRDLPWPAAVVNNCPCRDGGVMCQARQETTIAVHRPRTTP